MPSCSLLLENTVYKSLLLLLLTIWMTVASAQDVKAVYHITTGVEGAAAALNNIRNHLDAAPESADRGCFQWFGVLTSCSRRPKTAKAVNSVLQ